MWHMTGYRRQVTCDKWHMTDCVEWTFSQNFNSPALKVWELWCFEDLEEMDRLLNEWMTKPFLEQPRLHRVCYNFCFLVKICEIVGFCCCWLTSPVPLHWLGGATWRGWRSHTPPWVTTVKCRLDTVRYAVYSVQCTVYSVNLTVYSVPCTVNSAHFALYSVHLRVEYLVAVLRVL